MIQLINISKSFGKLQVLKNINISFHEGQSIAIIGPNGSGKTTLIKMLLGMVMPDSGEIFCENKSIKNAFAYRNQIGYMPQIGQYPPNLKISQLIDMMVDIRNIKQENTILDTELIDLFDLKAIYDKPLGTLSGGTKQKVSAALAFLFMPSILILDEPTAGLDPLSCEILKEKIQKEINNGKLILITSHIMADLEELASHILYLQDGEMQFFKEFDLLKLEFGEEKLNKIIAILMHTQLTKQTQQLYYGQSI
jgi:Cu-processing system ATP-binding protein